MADIDVAALQRDIIKTTKKLTSLGQKVEKKVLRKAMGVALNPYVKGLRDNAPQDEKDLRKTMGKQVTARAGVVTGVAGQSKAKRRRRKAVHAHIVDQDTRPHSITGTFTGVDGETRTGTFQHPGTDGDEFFERTAQQKKNEALKAFATKAGQETDAEASKLG